MENPNDVALADFNAKFTKKFGAGVIPWQAILAALAAMLGACPSPAAATVKAQSNRPLVHIRMRRRLMANGCDAECVDRCVTATILTVQEAKDAEIDAWVAAAHETD